MADDLKKPTPSPDQVAQDAVRSNQALGKQAGLLVPIPAGMVPAVAPGGETGLISEDEFRQARAKGLGYRVATMEEARKQQLKETYGDAGSQMAAAAYGMLDAAPFGAGKGIMFKGAETVLGGRAQAQEFMRPFEETAEANPDVHMLGEGVGFLIPGALTGGESLLASSAERAAANAIGKGVISTTAKWATQGALDGTLQGIGSAFSDAELGDPNQMAEKLMAGAAKGLVFGLGIGTGLGLIGGIASKLAGAAVGRIPNAGQIADGLMADSLKMSETDQRMLENMGIDYHRMGSWMRSEPQIMEWASRGGKVDSQFVSMLKGLAAERESTIQGSLDLIESSAKQEATPNIGAIFDRFDKEIIKPLEASPFHAQIAKRMQKELEEFGLKTGYYQEIQHVERPFEGAAFARKPYGETFDMAEPRFTAYERQPFEAPEFVPPKRTHEAVRSMMPMQSREEMSVFAKELETIKKEDAAFEKATAEHEKKTAFFESKHEAGQDTAQAKHLTEQAAAEKEFRKAKAKHEAAVAKHEAAQDALEQEHVAGQTKAEGKHVKEQHAQIKEKSQILRDEITGQPIPGAGKVSYKQLHAFKEGLEDLLYSESKATSASRVAQELRKAHSIIEDEMVKQTESSAYGEAIKGKRAARVAADIAEGTARQQKGLGLGSIGAAMGLGFLGPKGLAFGLASKVVRERGHQLGAALITRAEKLTALKGAANSVTENISAAAKIMVGGGIKAITYTKSRDKQADKVADKIKELALSPERVQALLKDHIDGDVAPTIQRAYINQMIKSLQYLAATAPQGTQLIPILPGASVTKPTKAAKTSWMRTVDVWLDPVGTVRAQTKKGQLTSDHVKALNTFYPTIANELRQETLSALAEVTAKHKMPLYQQRMQLGLLLGAPTDATLLPAFIVAQQAITEKPADIELYDNSGGGMVAPRSKAKRAPQGGGEDSMDAEDT